MATGITKRHSSSCPVRGGGRCRCDAGYEAWVFSKRDGKKIRRTFPTIAAAKSWRSNALSALEKGSLRPTKPTTLDEAWRAWFAGALAGTITNRSGDPYKPSALRTYERAMRLRVLDEFGQTKLAQPYRSDLQEFADGLLSEGKNPSTIKVTLLPLRAILRRAVAHGELAVNPCDGLELAAVRGRRERIASPSEAEKLLAAVPNLDRVIWATAIYSGLRRGELQALRVEDVDLANGVLRVERGWDDKEGVIALKSKAGRRRVPIAAALRDYLLEDRMTSEREGGDLVFGRSAVSPFYAKGVQERADEKWKAAKLERITFHECRHTFASLMIAAGVNAKALQVYMGHARVSITLDRYGHLMPGSEAEAAGLLDAYLAAQRKKAEDTIRGAAMTAVRV